MGMTAPAENASMSELDRALLNDFQRDFPLEPRPFAAIANRLGVTEAAVLARYRQLAARGVVSRIGAVVRPHRAGWSTLAAMAVPAAELEQTAVLVSRYQEVNHNYEREHRLNLWFVVTAPTRRRVKEVLSDITARSGHEVIELPLEAAYRVDLGFPLS